MSSNQSFQLPDLLGIVTGLQLRTNRHCRFATDASERWFAEGIKASQPQAPFRSDFGSSMPTTEVANTVTRIQLLSEAELKYLRSMKLGLLCALCFPLCDAPQLRVMTDLVTALFYSAMRESRRHESPSSQGSSMLSPENPSDLPRPGGLELLREHDLFRQLIKRALSKASRSWKERCSQSIHAFFDARNKISSWPSGTAGDTNVTTSPPPITIEEYIEVRRELYGTSLILDFAELLEIFEFPQAQGDLGEKIDKLRRAFSDILAFSMDVASYPLTHSRHPANPTDSDPLAGDTHPNVTQNVNVNFNLISILIANKRLSLQGAMNLAGTMLKDTYARFREAEKEVLDILDPPPPPPLSGPRLLRSRSMSVLSAGVSTLGASLSSGASSFLDWVMKPAEEGAGAGRGRLGGGEDSEEDFGVLMPGGMASSHNLSLNATTTPNSNTPPAPSISISLSPAPSLSPLSSSSSSLASRSRSSSSVGFSSGLSLPDITTAAIPPTIVSTKRYIQALKDCLVGTLHWAYETELFFGKKGAEVRAFGWVFVDQVPAIPGE